MREPMRETIAHEMKVWRDFKTMLTSSALVYVLCAAVVLCAMLGRVMIRTTIVRLGYELSATQEDHQQLVVELQALRTEVAARRSPDRMLREGKTHFRLELARPEQILTVRQ